MSDKMNRNQYPNILEDLRLEKGWSISEASQISGISIPTLYNLESGIQPPRFETQQKLEYAYGMPIQEIYAKCWGQAIVPMVERKKALGL